MSERIKVWPREGLLIRDEYTHQHIEAGQEVVLTTHIRQLMKPGPNGEDPDLYDHEPTRAPKNALREAFPDQRKATGLKSEKGEG